MESESYGKLRLARSGCGVQMGAGGGSIVTGDLCVTFVCYFSLADFHKMSSHNLVGCLVCLDMLGVICLATWSAIGARPRPAVQRGRQGRGFESRAQVHCFPHRLVPVLLHRQREKGKVAHRVG